MNKNIDKIIHHLTKLSTVDCYNELVFVMGYTPKHAAQILGVMIFEDIKFSPHEVVMGGSQWSDNFPYIDKGEGGWFSVVGGPHGVYGDGISTFEVWREGIPDVLSYLSKEEVTIELLKCQQRDIKKEYL